jgi:RNA polymerase sigma-70 factor (ECF subfamily)
LPGSPPDFGEAYDEHVWNVYGFFAYRVRRREDAEDLTQRVFERALRAWGRYDAERASVQTWLMTIARNLLIDHYRADRAATEEPYLDHHDPVGDPGPQADLGLSADLAAALEELGERDREILALRFGADLTGPQIAELTGLSLANVQQILSRNLRRLKGALEAAQAPSGPAPAAEARPQSSSAAPGNP